MTDPVKEFIETMDKEKEEDRIVEAKRKELASKKLEVDSYKYQAELDKIKQSESDLAKIKSANVGPMTRAEIDEATKDNAKYLDGAKNGMIFLNEDFAQSLPIFPGQFIVLGAKSGQGKSTAAANIAYNIIKQKNPLTGQNRKVLIITNEELNIAFFNRLTCIGTGLDYANHHSFTEEQKKTLIRGVGIWASAGVTVIHDDETSKTSSIEGIENIFEGLIRENIVYDAIIIDYSQKVNKSKKNVYAKLFEVQSALAYKLDTYKNIYPGAIIVMTQVMSNDTESPRDFQDRIRGSKDLFFPATVAVEIVPNIDDRLTKWVFHKHRHMGHLVGTHLETGYDAGKFVRATPAFKAEVERIKAMQKKSDFDKTVGMKTKEQMEKVNGTTEPVPASSG